MIEHQQFTAELARSLKAFKTSQQKVWDIAHTDENLPAHTLMLQEAGPLAESALDQLQSFANEEVATRRSCCPAIAACCSSRWGCLQRPLQCALRPARLPHLRGSGLSHQIPGLLPVPPAAGGRAEAAGGQLYRGAEGDLVAVRGDVGPFAELVGQVISKRQAPDWDQANHLMATEIEPALGQLATQLAGQVTQTRAEVESMGQKMTSAGQAINRTLLLATLTVIVLGTLVALLFSRRLTRDIASLVLRADLVANGRLPARPCRCRARMSWAG